MEQTIKKDGKTYRIRFSDSLAELPEAAQIRKTVFVEEQGFEIEFDDTDAVSIHCVLFDGDRPIAVGRAYPDHASGTTIVIGRIAALKAYRGQGLGSLVVTAIEQYAAGQGYTDAALSAQVRVRGFYETLGYTASGEEYLDEYCPHVMMYKKLTK